MNDQDASLWCSDALHDLLGFADSSLASYLVSVARKSKSAAAVVDVLKEGEVAADPSKIQSFAEALVQRTRPNKAIDHGSKQKRRTNAEWEKEAANYQLVEDDPEELGRMVLGTPQPEKKKRKESEPVDKTKGRRRKREVDTSSSEDSGADGVVSARQKAEERREKHRSRKEEQQQSALTEEERKELERERDIKERDEFQQPLKKKREIEDRLARGETVVDEATGQELSVPKLREQSRREYLKKREERELTLLKQSLEDEQELFRGEKLTAAERKRIEISNKILNMSSDRGADDRREDGFYRLPDEFNEKETKASQDQNLLKSRYIDPKAEKSEQDLWEESQTQKAKAFSFKKEKPSSNDNYEILIDDKIDFVMQGTKEGYDNRSKNSESEYPKANAELRLTPITEHEKILSDRKKLPVFAYREEFLAAVKDHRVLILVGETGSGKTTQIPQYLNEIGYGELGRIGCTQPRRVAAMSVAARVAKEMNVKLGHEVGYSIRFENCTSKKTVIQYMTDGMLLREILTEPDLASYSCMIIDEAHERTLHTDILFGLLKDIVRFRTDLKLIISSATLDAEKFSKYFDDANIFMIPGRMYNVDIYYTKAPEADYVDASVVTVLQIHVSQPLDGDCLVFLTGQEEIEAAAEILTQRCRNLGSRIPELIICPIFANLPSEQQAKIFEKTPKGARKVVLATNIAETSLTIDGICYVIDTGFNKQKTYNARAAMESLVVTPISQAAANQRAGRAGRTRPGKCFRLYTAWSFQHELEPNTVPEILRTNMANVVLLLKSLGIHDLIHFDFMDRPPADALIRALELLYALGSLNDKGELTKLGRKQSEFPLDPMLSKAVLASEKYECTSQVLSTVSMLSIGASIFYRPKDKAVHADTARMHFARQGGGDMIALLRCFSEWAQNDFSAMWCREHYIQVKSMQKARDIRTQLEALCDRVEIDHSVSADEDDIESVLKSITGGFFYHIAKLGKTGDYETIKQRKTVYIHPSSVLAHKKGNDDEGPPPLSPWLLYYDLAFTTKEYMRQVAPIEPSWLLETAPHYYQASEVEDSKSKKMPRGHRGSR
ncbi:hypothetical protein ACA910_003102 [Epithemia clementina (nom. ined.)]